MALLISIFCTFKSQNYVGEQIFGFTVSPLIPIDYFGAGPLALNADYSNIELSTKLGYQFGMVLRSVNQKHCA